VSYYKTIIIAEKSMVGTLAYKTSSYNNGSQTFLTGILPNVAFKEKK